jgi:hypothetical protein
MSSKLIAGNATNGSSLSADTTGILEIQTGSTPTTAITIDASQNVTLNNVIPSGSTVPANGMFLPTTNSVGFSTASTERMRIDSSGNVGVGTTAPAANLQVKAPSQGAGLGVINASHPGNTSFGVCLMAQTYAGTDNPSLVLSNYNGGSPNNFGLACDSSGNLLFMNGTNPQLSAGTERARMTAAGLFLINTTGQVSSERFNVTSDNVVAVLKGTNTSNVTTLRIDRAGTDGDGVTFFYGGAQKGYISIGSGGTTYNSLSDYRLKENVKPQVGALDRVLSLNPVSFTWKDGGKLDEGFIAHELQAIIPGAVQGKKDELDDEGNPRYQGVDQSRIVSVLVAAIKELKAEVDALKGVA